MYNFLQSFLNKRFTNEVKSRFLILGIGCSYIYTSGIIMYVKVIKKLTKDYNNIEDPIPQFFTCYFISHLSPYLTSSFIKGNCMSNVYKNLNEDNSSLKQRITTYSALLKITSSKQAIQRICDENVGEVFDKMADKSDGNVTSLGSKGDKRDGNNDLLSTSSGGGFMSIFRGVLHPKKVYDDKKELDEPEILFNMKMKCIENFLSNLNPERRKVPLQYMRDLVKLSKTYTTSTSKEFISRVLCLLLENEDNVQELIKTEHDNYMLNDDTVLSYLYSIELNSDSILSVCKFIQAPLINLQVTSELFPVVSIHAKCIDYINDKIKDSNKLRQLCVPNVYKLWNKYKDHIKTLVTTIELSFFYAFLRHFLSRTPIGSTKFSKFQWTMSQGWRTTRGLILLQFLFKAQDKIIQSEKYFNDDNYMLPMSFLIGTSTYAAMCGMAVTQKFSMLS